MKKDNTQVAGTGFAFTICCFFFLIFNLVIIYFVRGDSSAHLGSSSGSDYTSENGSGGDSNTTNYSPPASYQYNADPATAAYAGAYNTDVMPSAQVENNNL